ncbi:MAG: lytic transglycosylase domain-containing protein [Oscillospiraceae bacterium]|nr:lytic transglycosylase domain-containing protein [Oscillospiraceae bacterium]
MALSTDLNVRARYGAAAAVVPAVPATPDSNSFSQVFSAAYRTTGGTDYESYFRLAADTYQLPADLIKAVAKAESDFNANAVSSCGAQGIMQLMPATARSLGVTDSFDPAQNIMGGAKYLRQMLDSFGGDISKAVAAYNAGPNAVKKYGGVPPYQETQNYVTKVLGYAGGSVSVPASVPAAVPTPMVTTDSAEESSGSLTLDELTDLVLQTYHINGTYIQESAQRFIQQLLLQTEEENEEQKEIIRV